MRFQWERERYRVTCNSGRYWLLSVWWKNVVFRSAFCVIEELDFFCSRRYGNPSGSTGFGRSIDLLCLLHRPQNCSCSAAVRHCSPSEVSRPRLIQLQGRVDALRESVEVWGSCDYQFRETSFPQFEFYSVFVWEFRKMRAWGCSHVWNCMPGFRVYVMCLRSALHDNVTPVQCTAMTHNYRAMSNVIAQ